MKVTSACYYQYLFSHIPSMADADAKRVAEEIAAPLREAHHLILPGPPFSSPAEIVAPSGRKRPSAVLIASCQSQDDNQYLIQFLAHDTLISESIVNQPNDDGRNAISFWEAAATPPFADRRDQIGHATVLLAETDDDPAEIAQTIAAEYLRVPKPDQPAFSRFDWGTVCYWLQSQLFLALVTNRKLAVNGDNFLAGPFALWEAFRQKLIFEEKQADAFKSAYDKGMNIARQRVEDLHAEWRKNEQTRRLLAVKEHFVQFDQAMASVKATLQKMKMVFLTADINLKNIKRQYRGFPTREDGLFAPQYRQSKHFYQQLRLDWKYRRCEAVVLQADADALRAEVDRFPVRLWENELEELRSYDARIQRGVKNPHIAEELRDELKDVQKQLAELFEKTQVKDVMVGSRQVIETIIRLRHQKIFSGLTHETEAGSNSRGHMLNQMLVACHKNNPIHKVIYHALNHVRILGNFGAHPSEYIAERQSKEILSSLATVMEWYAQENGL